MSDLLPVAILVAAIAGFVGSGIYYSVLSGPLAAVRADGPVDGGRGWTHVVEFVRTLVVAAVTAGVASMIEIGSWRGGVVLGAALWLGFPLMLWVGAIVHEGSPVSLAAIHAGDWLLKLVVIGVVLGVWL